MKNVYLQLKVILLIFNKNAIILTKISKIIQKLFQRTCHFSQCGLGIKKPYLSSVNPVSLFILADVSWLGFPLSQGSRHYKRIQ